MSPVGLLATMTMEGRTNTDVFLTYLENILCPALRPGSDRDHGQPAVHKNEAVRQKSEAGGCRRWFLPAYSPDFNPIEHAFAKPKHFPRKAKARPQEALQSAIAAGLAAHHRPGCAGLVQALRVSPGCSFLLKTAVA